MKRIFIQLDVCSVIMGSLPGGIAERQVNTSHAKTPKNTTSSETRGQSLLDSKKQGAIIGVNNRPLSEKASSPLVALVFFFFFFTTVFPFQRALLLCELESEIPTCEPLCQMAKTAFYSNSNISGAFPFGLTNSRVRPPFSVGNNLRHGNFGHFSECKLKRKIIYVLYLCQRDTY